MATSAQVGLTTEHAHTLTVIGPLLPTQFVVTARVEPLYVPLASPLVAHWGPLPDHHPLHLATSPTHRHRSLRVTLLLSAQPPILRLLRQLELLLLKQPFLVARYCPHQLQWFQLSWSLQAPIPSVPRFRACHRLPRHSPGPP